MADPVNTGGMIALLPADPQALAVPGGEPVEQIHLTLAYLGDATGLTLAQSEALQLCVLELAHDMCQITSRIFAHSLWNVDSEDASKEPVAVYEIDDPLRQLASAAEWAQSMAFGILGTATMPEQHWPFKPHITAGYALSGYPLSLDALSATGEVTFDRIRLALAGQVYDYPLHVAVNNDSPMARYAARSLTAAAQDAITVHLEDAIPVTFPVIIVEGMHTSDGRYIEPGALDHRALPLPILAQTANPVNGDGHDGAEVIGMLDTLVRIPGEEVTSKETGEPFPKGTFVWTGTGQIDGAHPASRLARKGYLTGNSADLTAVTADYIYPDDEGQDSGAIFSTPEEIRLTAGIIAATTLVPIPAFADAYVQIDGVEITPAEQPAGVLVATAWYSPELGDGDCTACQAVDEMAVDQAKRDRAEKAGHAMPGGRYPIENADDLDKAINAVGRAGGPKGTDKDRNAVRRHIMVQAKRLGLESKIPDTWNRNGSLQKAAASAARVLALTASGGESGAALANLSDFADPELAGPTALTVDANGHLFGHLALWGTCHLSFPGRCVEPPPSSTGYAYFHTGATQVRDGDRIVEIATGRIAISTDREHGGHADTSYGYRAAVDHYDNTCTVVADVVAGEDAHGIWVAGALRPSCTEERLAELRAAPLSGDWRRIGNSMELVAALGVNTAGYPVPRARVAAGAPIALVAAGVMPPQGDAPLSTEAEAIYQRVVSELEETYGLRRTDETDDLGARRAAVFAQLAQADLEERHRAAFARLA
jgi:2'-5' RNA ligase